ncbi:MAG TPA: NAD-glutamate dehydrogenase domain-containing protein, partial [Candidatus Binataceae bacterium]
ILAAFNSFPKDELFRAPVAELIEQLRLILDVKSESAVRLYVLPDVHRGNVIVLIVMPRDAFSADVRTRIQEELARRLNGSLVYYYLALGEGYTARLHFCFAAAPPSAPVIRELEASVARLARRWNDSLDEALIQQFGAQRGRAVALRWANASSAEYQAATTIERAVADIGALEALLSSGANFTIETVLNDTDETSELRIIGLGEPPILSDLMPTLQNCGVRILSEDAHELKPVGDSAANRAYVQIFRVQGADQQPLAKFAGATMLADAIRAVREGLAEDDPLNALTLSAGLEWRQVALIRAYLAAGFQMRLAPARPTLRRLMLLNPDLAKLFFDLFDAKLNPDRETSPDDIGKLRAAYLARLSGVENITDDRAARSLLSMLEATVRTNFYSPAPSPDPYVALKFESARITSLPDTAPLYEIHVTSPRMEGCHLRAGKIARGGIRFSDRPDDYRTEILDLMKTQTVKNAIIVPIGSKGGFIVKPGARQATSSSSGVEAYQTLINAMLDLTDNIIGAGIEHPARVKVLDNDGPYLVVAADKGTAAFSDIANSIAISRKFWLGDAFASGGEHGYDHKKLGITARGAWESAKRHLLEMGRDPNRGAPITMIGIGDMSGDVFGNGLLQSQNLKLVAAFDHRHIFIDPNPDPARSFAERKRLYEVPRSQWPDYDPSVISTGGGVFRRGQKRVELSPQARAVLGCDAEALDGESLIHAILRAPVDMLYNGGIGTYVRASDETDAEVGDHANDSCRIAAPELRAKIVVEGGNLGFTQKARIEYALNGGRINTDAIDNSAGVDTSDHEVNLKILMEPAVANGEVKFDDRNRYLAQCADEVAGRVLRDNHDQVLSLSLEQIRSRSQASAFRDHLQAIEDRGLLRRREELRERRSRYPGLTRPELAVVTAYTKIDLAIRLGDSAVVADPYLIDRFLRPYFPPEIADRFAAQIPGHRLRRELIATRLVNELVDLTGSIFVFGIVRDHGVDANEAVRAWIIAADILNLHGRAELLKSCGETAPGGDAELHALLAFEPACSNATGWVLANCDASIAIGAAVTTFRPEFEALSERFESMLAGGERLRFEELYRELRRAVGSGELAHDLARLSFAGHVLDVLGISITRSLDPLRVAQAYFSLNAQIDFALLQAALAAQNSEDPWERRATQQLADELRSARIDLCNVALSEKPGAPGLQSTREKHERLCSEAEKLLAEVRTMPAVSMSALQVAIRSLSRLASAARQTV